MQNYPPDQPPQPQQPSYAYPPNSSPQPQQLPYTYQPNQSTPSPWPAYPYPPAQQTPQGPQPYAQYAPPQPYAQPMPMPAMNTNVNVNVQQPKQGPGLLIRAIYFLCIGWWLGFFWLQLGYALCLLVVTLPLGLVMLNRLPQVLTLRPRSSTTSTNVSVSTMTMAGPAPMPGMPAPMTLSQTVNVNVSVGGAQQTSFLVRVLYFLFIGWWAGWIWANVGYALCLFVVTLPLGLMMLNRLPAVITLRKN